MAVALDPGRPFAAPVEPGLALRLQPPHDLRAVGVIVAMAEAAGKPFCFCINGATPRITIAGVEEEAFSLLLRVGPLVKQLCDVEGDEELRENLFADERSRRRPPLPWKVPRPTGQDSPLPPSVLGDSQSEP